METHRVFCPTSGYLWRLSVLIALVVPYVTNMGLLAKTVYGRKTLYKSDRLTVTGGRW